MFINLQCHSNLEIKKQSLHFSFCTNKNNKLENWDINYVSTNSDKLEDH